MALTITKNSNLDITFTTRIGEKTIRHLNNEMLFSFAEEALRYPDTTYSNAGADMPGAEGLEDFSFSVEDGMVVLVSESETFKLGTVHEFAAALLAAYEKCPAEWAISTYHVYDLDPETQADFVRKATSQDLIARFDKYANRLRNALCE